VHDFDSVAGLQNHLRSFRVPHDLSVQFDYYEPIVQLKLREQERDGLPRFNLAKFSIHFYLHRIPLKAC
jgi:hypothetical protein